MLNPPSTSQQLVIDSIKNYNIIVDAVAGSGKTTTILHIASNYKQYNILLLTYNSKLKIESREKVKELQLDNIEVHSYHAFCVKYYDNKCFTDTKITKLLENKAEIKIKNKYDLIILDEVQDMTPLYYRLLCKIMVDLYGSNNVLNLPNNLLNLPKGSNILPKGSNILPKGSNILPKGPNNLPKLCIFGDKNQSIFQFNSADHRFITCAKTIFNFNDYEWSTINLDISYRLTNQMSIFINKCILNHKRIKTCKKGSKINYIICDAFANHPFNEIKRFLSLKKCLPDDIFVLAPSTKASAESVNSNKVKLSPVRVLANKLTESGIPIYVSGKEQKLDKDVIKGKIVFSTFHQVKGLERDHVLIFSFDNSYYKYFNKTGNKNICCNELYVALTRAKKNMTLIHHYQNQNLPFVNLQKVDRYGNLIKYTNICYEKKEDVNKIKSIGVSSLTDFLPQDILKVAKDFMSVKEISNASDFIDIPCKVKQGTLFENVSEITGTAVPACYQYLVQSNMEIYEHVTKHFNDLENMEFVKENGVNSNKISNIKIDKLLKISNYYCADMSKYYYKLNQIKSYDWLSYDNLELCMKRLTDLQLSCKSLFEHKVSYDKNETLKINNNILQGSVDCFDKINNHVYEFKCVNELKNEHFIQLATYAFLIEDQIRDKNKSIKFIQNGEILSGVIEKAFKNKRINVKSNGKIIRIDSKDIINDLSFKYYLFNILNNQMFEIESTYDNLFNMTNYLIECHFNHRNTMTDIEFIDMCTRIKEQYFNTITSTNICTNTNNNTNTNTDTNTNTNTITNTITNANTNTITNTNNNMNNNTDTNTNTNTITNTDNNTDTNTNTNTITNTDNNANTNTITTITNMNNNTITNTITNTIKDHVVVLDIETDGTQYIVEIAYNIYDNSRNLVKSKDLLLNDGSNKVDYYKRIPLKEIKKGLHPKVAIEILYEDLQICSHVVCHNVGFDMGKIRKYLNKYGLCINGLTEVCTMSLTRSIVKATGKKGQIKQPKLEELYKFLFNENVDHGKAHRGTYDVEITSRCYFELVDLGIC